MKYSQIVACFEQAGYVVESIDTEQGCIATIAAAARVIAVAPDRNSDSFLFNPTGITNHNALRDNLYCVDGAPGGDRLWIAPEYQYHWLSEPKETTNFSNYQVPKSIDPAHYQMQGLDTAVQFKADMQVLNQQNNRLSEFTVERTITPLDRLISTTDVACVSYQIDQRLQVYQGVAGLWNIAQVPIGSAIVIALQQSVAPNNYYNQGDMLLDNDACTLYVNGTSNAKISYQRDVATGNSAAFYCLGEQLNLVYRLNSVIDDGYYCDGLSADDSKDQVVQAWDGFGFGELEYHSIAAGDDAGQDIVSDSSQLHCVRGKQSVVLDIASEFLDLPVVQLERIVQKIPAV